MFSEKLIGWTRGAIAVVIGMSLSSCFEAEDEFTLNPDGSGKVKHECTFQEVNLMNDGEELTEESMKDAVVEVLEKSEGVEAWKDVSFKRLDDGRIWFQGTAYFKDLAGLDIKNQSMLKFAWIKGDAGRAELVLQMNDEKENEPAVEELSTEEKAKKLKGERAKFQQSKPMFAAILGGMKQEVSFVLPGEVTKSSNFSKLEGGRLGISFVGSKMIEVLDSLINDDEWLLAQGFDRENGPEFDDKLSGLMFGEEAPVMVGVKDANKALFDYQAEVAVARKETAELQEKLGASGIAPAAKGEPLKSVRVVGVRMVEELDKNLDLRPFNYNPGMTFSVLAELPGSVLDFTDKCQIEIATAADGTSLLKGDKEWDRKISFPRLSKDKASVLFEVELKNPEPGMTTLSELSGKLEYRVAGATKEIELGLESVTEGAKSEVFSVEVKSVEAPDDGSQEFGLKLKMKPDDLVAAYVVVDGDRSELKQRGYGSSGGSTNFTFSSPVLLNVVDSIVVEVHDQLEVFEVPFKLENLSIPSATESR